MKSLIGKTLAAAQAEAGAAGKRIVVYGDDRSQAISESYDADSVIYVTLGLDGKVSDVDEN